MAQNFDVTWITWEKRHSIPIFETLVLQSRRWNEVNDKGARNHSDYDGINQRKRYQTKQGSATQTGSQRVRYRFGTVFHSVYLLDDIFPLDFSDVIDFNEGENWTESRDITLL